MSKESAPIHEESILETAGKFVFKILGIGILIGAAFSALKLVGSYLTNQVTKLKNSMFP